MQLVRWDPFGMAREFDRALAHSTPRRRSWAPRIDAYDHEGSLVIRVEAPGVAADDLDITVENGTLTISGTREFDHEVSESGYHRKEIFHGSFTRSLFLPDSADADDVNATSKDGIVEITIPTRVEALPKKVTVAVQN